MNETERLVADAVAGDRLALERLLLAAHRDLLARISAGIPAGLRPVVSAEDVLQEVFADAFRNIRAFQSKGDGAFFAWLATMADHRVIDAVRRERAAKRGAGRNINAADADGSVLALLDLFAVHERTPSRSAAGHEAVDAVRAALAGLKPDYCQALTLRYVEGLSALQTAERLGRTERAVHKLCSRGLQRLREALGEQSRFLSRG